MHGIYTNKKKSQLPQPEVTWS